LISAELVQTSSGQRLWGESYDRPAADLMLVQDSIAANVADRLRLPLSTEEKLALRRHGTDNPSAYELFLKARPWLALDTEEGDLEARRLFQQAAAADSRFTAPHVGIAIIHSRAAVNGYEPPAEAWARVDEAVAKALELEPGDLSAICQQINRRFYSEWDFASIEQEYQRVRQDPKLARGRLFEPTFAIVLFSWARGDAEDAVALLERALEDDPASIETRTMMADLLVQAGRLDAAIAQYRTLVAEDPGEARAWFGLAGALRRRGELSAAIDALRKAFELSGETEGAEALVSARTDDDYERAEVAVARSRLADLQTLAQERYVSPLNIARLHAQVGDRESAFATLEAAFAERSPGLVFLKVDGAWDRIRDDPRFAALVRRVGIP
jgi:serine/threonine-protein kinase